MSFERMPGPTGPEPVPPALQPDPDSGGGSASGGSPAAMQLQVLATEHWGLLATRSLAWNESFTRAGMFLSALSGAIVALALVAQATAFGGEFAVFALVILPVVLFLGITTFARMGASNYYDAMCVVGMNRIRHAYLRLTPEVEEYLVFGTHDDEEDVNLTMGVQPGGSWFVFLVSSTPFVVATINGVLAGVIGALVALQLGAGTPVSVVVAILVALLTLGGQFWLATRGIAAAVASYRPKFPRAKSDAD
jgi:hypothetical protein